MVALLVTGAVVGSLAYGTFRHLTISGFRSEARLMLSWINTLESAYEIEHRRFVGFDEFYGAPMGGIDQCPQPSGAQSLGFSIDWCSGVKGAHPVRYAYKLLLEERLVTDPETGKESTRTTWHARAVSGTDERHYGFVCFGANQTDEWQIRPGGFPVHVRKCEAPR